MPAAPNTQTRAAFIQRSMWAAAQRFRHTPLNVMILAWRVIGPIQIRLLEQAVNELIARHPTLRARLTMVDGVLMQEVGPASEIVIDSEVLQTGTTPDQNFKAAIALLRKQGQQPISLDSGRPPNVRFLKLGSNDGILCFFVHHAMCDGWSRQIIIRDLTALYATRCEGGTGQLAPLDEQFSDIAETQIQLYERGGFSTEIEYWKSELAGLGPAVKLPASANRKGNRDFLASSPVHMESSVTLRQLRDAARNLRASLFSFVLAGVSVFFHKWTRAEDFAIGIPTLNRWSRPSMEFVGCATTLLPARIHARSGMRFDELVSQVHATMRRLLAYGRVPLEVILRETQGGVAADPLCSVWCQIRQMAPSVSIDSLGLTFQPLLIERGTILADLDIDMLESNDGLLCEFAHRPSLFESALIHEFMSDYGFILRTAAAEPQISVIDLCHRAEASMRG